MMEPISIAFFTLSTISIVIATFIHGSKERPRTSEAHLHWFMFLCIASMLMAIYFKLPLPS